MTHHEWQPVLEAVAALVEAHPVRVDSADCAGATKGDLWDALVSGGFANFGAHENDLGAGEASRLGVHLAQVLAGAHTPFADAVGLGGWLASSGGFGSDHCVDLPLVDALQWGGAERPAEGSCRLSKSARGWVLDGTLERVPWARAADRLFYLDTRNSVMIRVSRADLIVECSENLAGEPLDRVTADAAPAEVADLDASVVMDRLLLRGALLRAAAIAGSMNRILGLTVAYVNERQQFGGPLGHLGAVQQLLAELAAEVVVTHLSVATATSRFPGDESMAVPLARMAAKARASRAAGRVSAIAHQLHGAMGITREYPLERLTRSLLAWRDEYGTEKYWNRRVGDRAARVTSDELWDGIVSAGASWQPPNET